MTDQKPFSYAKPGSLIDCIFFVFDVESIGLHGEGFAVGVKEIAGNYGANHGEFFAACPSERAQGTDEGRAWIREHVDPILLKRKEVMIRCTSPKEVRAVFWQRWMEAKRWAKEKGRTIYMAADVPWPVEANFLAACIRDQGKVAEWEGPYPLLDIASIRFAAGLDLLGTEERLEGNEEVHGYTFGNEMPPHHPLADANQSTRLLMEALKRLHL